VFLGVDIGSVSLKLALLDAGGEIRFTHYRRTRGRPAGALVSALELLHRECGVDGFDGVAATGSGKHLVASREGVGQCNEILAHARAVARLCPGVRTVIEIGGQDSKLIRLDGSGFIVDHAFNDLCAAGCGAFLDQQAGRLGVDVAELSEMAARARVAVPIASRCAVFAKSDMIHHQQEGVPPGKVARGLCFALARNYLANMLRGRDPALPIAFCGGVARNRGVRRAFIELLQLGHKDWVLPEYHDVMGAIGAALFAGENIHPVPLKRLKSGVGPGREVARLARLPGCTVRTPAVEPGDPEDGVYLGLDLGSVSTKGVAVDPSGRVVASHYTATEGLPLERLGQVLEKLKEGVGGAPVLGCGVTGSGRMVAGSACRADVVKDEISAQLCASRALDPEVDTVFEIGGQDAKVLVVEDGQLRDFALNRICAAGTGSFLSEQAGRLRVRVEEEFGERALAASSPVSLGSRCTVFMDSDLIHHQQQGCRTGDLLAGLAYSVAQNFIEHVVEGRRIGRRVWFQGGVAANPAVRAAFEALLDREIHVHPHHALTGAWGAALLAQEEMERRGTGSAFVGFDRYSPEARTRHFTCKHCPNHCEVVRVTIPNQPPLAFGGGCDRYERADRKEDVRHRTRFYTQAQEELESVFENQPDGLKRQIGLPRALWTHALSPFWVGFFNALGVRVVSSSRSSRSLFRRGLSGVISEHCFGVKLSLGHVRDLMEEDVEWIFLPSYGGLPRPAEDMRRDHQSIACPYVQTLPDIARAGFPEARLLGPRVNLSRGLHPEDVQILWREIGRPLQAGRRQVEKGAAAGWAAWARHRSRMRQIGARAVAETREETAVVLAGRPYQLYDSQLCFNLPARIASCGATVIPSDVLPLQAVSLEEEWERVYWKANRDLIRLTEWLEEHPNLLPVHITAFACGPDAFVTRYLQENRKGRPLLVLELDEHTAEAGVTTRLQAYLANSARANARPGAARKRRFAPVPYSQKRFEGRTIYIPNLSDHTMVMMAAFRREGCEAHLLPPISIAALQEGRAWSSGRECNPFAFILGDLLSLVKRPGFNPARACLFIPSTSGPCLLSQFPAGFELALRQLGAGDLLINDIRGPELRKLIKFSTLVAMWEGLVAVEVLAQLLARCRPFEKSPGAAERVHAENIYDLECSILADDVPASLQRSRERLQAVTGPVDSDRPEVAVVGDIFTRINPVANADLHRRIEKLGCVVRAPPMFTDTAWHDAGEAVVFALRRGDRKDALASTLLGALQGFLGRRLQWGNGFAAGAGVRYRDWSWWKVEQMLRGRLTHDVDGTMAMNVALALEAVRTGADAVINAICHNCMVGMVSDTIFKRMAEEPGAPPVVTLAFDGLQETNTDTRLEAVCERAKARRQRGRWV
jgi:predicted CoA-substrate-specific enzyme activase